MIIAVVCPCPELRSALVGSFIIRFNNWLYHSERQHSLVSCRCSPEDLLSPRQHTGGEVCTWGNEAWSQGWQWQDDRTWGPPFFTGHSLLANLQITSQNWIASRVPRLMTMHSLYKLQTWSAGGSKLSRLAIASWQLQIVESGSRFPPLNPCYFWLHTVVIGGQDSMYSRWFRDHTHGPCRKSFSFLAFYKGMRKSPQSQWPMQKLSKSSPAFWPEQDPTSDTPRLERWEAMEGVIPGKWRKLERCQCPSLRRLHHKGPIS